MTGLETGASPKMKRKRNEFPRRFYRIAAGFLIVLFLFLLYQMIYPMIINTNAGGVDSLPVSIRAGSAADYGLDPHRPVIPVINENILNQLIADFPATGSPKDRLSTLQVSLSNPVPTMTLDRNLMAAVTPSLALPATPTRLTVSPAATGVTPALPTATPLIPTSSPTYFYSITPTLALTATYTSPATQTPTFPYASTPIPTYFYTATPAPTYSYTSTPQPTNSLVPTAKPTNTPLPPNTPQPTNTTQPANTPQPSNTPQPPNTPLPSSTPKSANTPKPTNTHRPTSNN